MRRRLINALSTTIGLGLLGVGFAGQAAVQAGTAGNTNRRPETILTTKNRITAFAQDGGRIAWIARKGAALDLHMYALGTGRNVTIPRIGFPIESSREFVYGKLVFAGGRALWKVDTGGGNTETSVTFRTASWRDRRVRTIEELIMGRDPRYGASGEAPDPPLVGHGGMLAYYSQQDGHTDEHRQVERVLGHRAIRLFRISSPLDLAIDQGRIAAVQEELHLGDGCGCSLAPSWSPDSTKIAFLWASTGNDEADWREIAVMNRDGSGRRYLTGDGELRRTLEWSPDGTKFAYAYAKEAGDDPVVAVANVDDRGAHDVTAGGDPSWSPDGQKLIFTRTDPGRIYVANPDGSGVRMLGKGRAPDWSPDGTQIAFARGGALYVMRGDGSSVRQLVGSPGGSLGSPDWSPDGQRIAFWAHGISVVNLDGSGRKRLTKNQADGAPKWSPDGQLIAFASLRNDVVNDYYDGRYEDYDYRYEIYVMRGDGSAQHPLTFSHPAEFVSVVQLRTAKGALLRRFQGEGAAGAVALSGRLAAVLTRTVSNNTKHIALFDIRSGNARGTIQVPTQTDADLVASGRWVVFRTGNTIRVLDTVTRKLSVAAIAKGTPIGLSVTGRRLAWAESARGHGSRIRSLILSDG